MPQPAATSQHMILPDSRRLLLRPVREEDAANLLALLRQVVAERIYIGLERTPEDVESERRWLRAFVRRQRTLALVADVHGELVGFLTLEPGAFGQKDAHVATLGIMVARPFRGLGVGTAMVEYAVAWARHQGFERIQLEVFATNVRALALYRKCGFVEEGRRRGAYRLPGLGTVDAVHMALFLDP
ncbi:MAG: GNAT family N-acetyltransferase [Ardenticatenia bacterium]|nr:GNAT family N-acetyltransferase [Ardenticatenia bacterium]